MALSVEIEHETSKDAGQALKNAQRKRLRDSAQVGLSIAVERAPEDRGKLKQGQIDPEWRSDGSLVWGFGGVPYIRAQEFGTQPFYPPLEPLLEWSERVTGEKGLGYYVARVKLPEEGIEEKRFTRDGRDRQKRWLDSNGLQGYLEDEL